jgi:hypothetical protein
MRLPSAPALLSRDICGCGGRNRTYDLKVMSLASYLCSTPQCLYKRQDLHLHGLVAYQPTPDGVMSIYRSISRKNASTTLVFFDLQHVKELCKFRFFESAFIVSKYTVLFPFFLNNFVEEGGIEPPSCSGSLRTHSQA